jgi:hypothetical protein
MEEGGRNCLEVFNVLSCHYLKPKDLDRDFDQSS